MKINIGKALYGNSVINIRNFALLTAGILLNGSVQTANAGDNGGKHRGKPFVAINNQIVAVEGAISSLQEQLNLLVARVDTVEQRVTANENTISTLQAQNQTLGVLIQQNLTSTSSIQTEIASLQQTNADLQAMIAANSGDIATLQTEVDANKALITTLQEALLMVQSNAISLETSLQTQIANNSALIEGLQSQINEINSKLALKQDLINGICPNGSAMQQILSNGSVICEGASASSGQLQSVYSWNISAAISGAVATVEAYCPSGYIATGAGFVAGLGWDIIRVHTGQDSSYANFGLVRGINNNLYTDNLFSYATCTRIAS